MQVLICKTGTQGLSYAKTGLTSGLLRKHNPLLGLGEPWTTSVHSDSDPGRSEPQEGEAHHLTENDPRLGAPENAKGPGHCGGY